MGGWAAGRPGGREAGRLGGWKAGRLGGILPATQIVLFAKCDISENSGTICDETRMGATCAISSQKYGARIADTIGTF